jgi:K+-sensing histidine kinase KdpD
MRSIDADELGKLLGLIVHDLRNPAATIGANVAFIREVTSEAGDDDDLGEAMTDVEQALGDLMRGLEQVAWIGRWLSRAPASQVADGDVGRALSSLASPGEGVTLEITLPDAPLEARGGATVAKLVEVLAANTTQHARGGTLAISARREGDEIIVDLVDGGVAIGEDIRERCFSLAGQHELKSRKDGRYGRVAALFAAAILADTLGARLEAGGRDGEALFRIRLEAL